MKISALLIFISIITITSFACEKRDGIVYISEHLGSGSYLIDAVKKSEVLAKRKEWREAAIALKDILEEQTDETLACSERADLVIGYAYASYLFNAKNDDPVLPCYLNQLIDKNSKLDFSPYCADLYRLLMAYYWSLHDTKSHDNTLKKLVLYDKNAEFDFVNLLYACLERKSCRSTMKDFLSQFNGNKGEVYNLAVLFYSGLSDEEIKEGIIKWLDSNYNARGFIMRCFVTQVASLLSIDDVNFISLYCSKLNEWLTHQSDMENRRDIITFVLSERYRLLAIVNEI
ncbi:hypothetical protein IKZ40_06175 [bacterium]|nr:hypothetical protein [bacterium]